MGWLSRQRERRGAVSFAEVLEIDGPDPEDVIDHARGTDRSRAFYAVVRHRVTGEVYGLCLLAEQFDGQLAVKLVDETMGPVDIDCPRRILDRLEREAPNPRYYGREWRDRCRERLDRQDALAAWLKPGVRFALSDPLHFGDGVSASEFELVRGNHARRLPDGALVGLGTGWRVRYDPHPVAE